ncbi:RE1, partial [Symbiodinium sp. CCMP2456]
ELRFKEPLMKLGMSVSWYLIKGVDRHVVSEETTPPRSMRQFAEELSGISRWYGYKAPARSSAIVTSFGCVEGPATMAYQKWIAVRDDVVTNRWLTSTAILFRILCLFQPGGLVRNGWNQWGKEVGRDKGEGYRYFLACAYAIPNDYCPGSGDVEGSEYEPSIPEDREPEGLSHELDDLFGDLSLPESRDGVEVLVKVVDRRVREKRPEANEDSKNEGGPSDLPPAKGGEKGPKGTRTLFFGVPLRSKRGKEVFPQVQAVVNRLEASGYPVQRYHADRAKELRSALLVDWLREKRIHHTWTAGESPAGNRAELAVQQLKGFVRKLLAVAELDKKLWPLALLHAANRNWIAFAESVGVPQPQFFLGEMWHAAEDWEGSERWVIAAFVPRDFKKATEEHWDKLRDLGFPVDGLRRAQGGLKFVSVGPDEGCNSELGGLGGQEDGDWEVGVPVPVMDYDLYDRFVHWHGCVAKQCRLLTAELCDAIGEVEILTEVARLLRGEELLAEWLERSLAVCGGVGEVGGIVKALDVEVPLGPEASPDTFLQTRTVGLAEARKELNLWVEPAQDEVLSLETVNRAVDRVQDCVVEEWVSQGMTVVQLPGKVVLTRKSGTGKRRCRAVCCGNHLPTDKLGLTREELYASGAESLSVKVSLTFAARNRLWVGVTIDVKSAFLYAPIRSDSKGTEERIVVKPPGFLVELGVLSRGDRWWIRKALYGLPTSPRDWGRYRDDEFTKFKLKWGQQEYSLFQTKSDSALWLARRSSEGFLSEICGILAVYVDDLAFFGPVELCQAFIAEVQGHWKTSEPERLGKEPVTFCGIELTLHSGGYRMSQRAYVQELLNRYGVEDSTSAPIAKWVEPEVGPPPSAEEVREAQGITGALLWISTRTRPDLAYLVSRCGQQATKAPQWSISYGRQALAYLKGTQEFGIEVPFDVGKTFSDHGLLAIPRTDSAIELYTDASHSPGGDRLPASLLRLALLAVIPGVNGQPNFDPVTGVVFNSEAGFGLGASIPEGSDEPALEDDALVESSTGLPGASVPAVPEEGSSEGIPGRASEEADSESSDFNPQDWQEAQRKLEDQERRTGLTFVQRVRLRKQIAAGQVVDPPVLQQRFGGIPYWLGGNEGNATQESED